MVKKWIHRDDLEKRPRGAARSERSQWYRDRAIESRERSAEFTLKRDGRWRCEDCHGAWHHDGEECPLTRVAVFHYIERELARATVPGIWAVEYLDGVLHRSAANVNAWAGVSEMAAEIWAAYSHHRVIGPYLRGEITEKDFWADDGRKGPKPKTVSLDESKIDYLLRDKSRKPIRSDDSRPDGYFDYHTRPSNRTQIVNQEKARSRRRVPRIVVLDEILQKLSHRQRVVYELTVLSEPPVPIAEVAAELGIRDQSQISRIKRQAIERVTKMLTRKSVK